MNEKTPMNEVSAANLPRTNTSTRLMSLDVLRGLDMLFLCVLQPFVWACSEAFNFQNAPIMRQFDHPWGGFVAYDVIMPLFIFMSGAAVPFAIQKRLSPSGRPTAAFWKHLASRVLLLWFLGFIAQGHLLDLDPLTFSPYCNTLQTIAVGYAAAMLALAFLPRHIRFALPAALALIYAAILAFCGDYSATGNAAIRFENWLLAFILPENSKAFARGYTWFLTSFMFAAMGLTGAICTEILREKIAARKKVQTLFILAAILLALSFLTEAIGIPCIKQFFTLTFTLRAMGVCIGLLTGLYLFIDVLGFRRGWSLAILYGQTSLACYMLGDIFTISEGSHGILSNATALFTKGLRRFLPSEFEDVVISIGSSILLTFCLWLWRRARHRAKN